MLEPLSFETLPPTERAPISAERKTDAPLSLLVIVEEGVSTHPLTVGMQLSIGREPTVDVHVDDPLVSREHARLYVRDVVELEDLGSANGTKIRGQRVVAHEKTPIGAGQVVEIGSAILVLQEQSTVARRRRLWSHGYFEVRLEEECARNARGRRSPFAVLRVRVDAADDETLVQATLTKALRSSDVVASYAPGEYELLLVDTAASRAERIAERITDRFVEAGHRIEIGIASFPRDGLTADALIAHAGIDLALDEDTAPSSAAVVEDPAMVDLYRVVDRVAQGTISVLLVGETGVGKEVVAEALHRRSPRVDAPFVRLNCAALTQTLVESELFGHVRGAFTGADQDKRGLIEAADGGTVFLDEVGELPLPTQATLLRVLERREVQRVGSLEPRPVDVRFVSATNRDLEEEIAHGRFREDLFYRLNGVTIAIPPLRDRPGEIALLARMFVDRVSHELGVEPPALSDRAEALLGGYHWPGNIRELRNMIERAVLLCTGDLLDAEHLPVDKLSATWSSTPARPRRPRAAAASPEHDERKQRILDALDVCAGNQTRAAEHLGVSRRTLTKWLGRYDIPRPRKR